MKLDFTLIVILFALCIAARAQVAPALTGPNWPMVSGTLRYNLSYTQLAQFSDGSEGNTVSSALSGELTYANASRRRPFSLAYSGGDAWTLAGANGYGGYFQHLLATQGLMGRRWTLNFGDNVSLSPQTPTTGFSGIPGVGTLPSQPGQPTQTVLALKTRSIENATNGSFSYSLGSATSLGLNSSYAMLRFPNGGGLPTNQTQVGSDITRRLDARDSVVGQYSFNLYTYPGVSAVQGTQPAQLGTEAQSAQLGYRRIWGRRFTTNVSVGPEWTRSTDSTINMIIPPATDLSMQANVSYGTRRMSASLGYFQGSGGGGGVITEIGVHEKTVTAALTRYFGKKLTINTAGSYMRTQGILQLGLAGNLYTLSSSVTNAAYGEVSMARSLGRYMHLSANYSAIYQSAQQSSIFLQPTNAVNGTMQIISFGIEYSPREMHFRR